MKPLLRATIPFLLSTALTGVSCHLAGLPRPDLLVAVLIAAVVSGGVAYAAALLRMRRQH